MVCPTDTSRLPQYEAALQLEAKATAYTLEAGIIFHSIFIGITLGSTSSASSARSLMIALMFHQANEVRPRPSCLSLIPKPLSVGVPTSTCGQALDVCCARDAAITCH